ncbi:putative Histidine kinase [Candidatus Terasakiella magnetica]|uniref:histidine kinase n=1 Tax=Candidatus Terasakiella magnetica TaxID=1867952 RepID=A0A1C3RLZ3_9PROT|nr:PAS domain-containing hybrid sensor histidine kinase/response regulator [Candidatus Terasakiella magnetica]SCA58286.1 putative Histidine kinase [Candidatus Terasakiella magnetica]
MKRRSNPPTPQADELAKIVGLGERSARKNYYPQLRAHVSELERFQKLIDLASNAFLIIDAQNRRIVDSNQKAKELFSIPEKDLIKLDLSGFHIEEEILKQIESFDEGSMLFEGHRLSTDQTEHYYLFDFKWVKVEHNHYGILEGRDITERKLAEKALQDARDHLEERVHERTMVLEKEIEERRQIEKKLEQAKIEADNANQAKSDFLSNMSHELRTPLNGILGFAQLFNFPSDPPLNTKQKDYIGQIINSGKHLLELINDILDLAKIEAGKVSLNIETFRVGEVIDDSLDLVNPIMSNYNVSFDMPHHVMERRKTITADKMRLKQVLINLLSNAAKYNTENGHVFLEINTFESYMRFDVRDTGKGISPEGMKSLFKPFSRLNEENSEIEGTGIGLTITKNLLKMMKGYMEVESTPGKGSCFSVFIPLAQGENTQAEYEEHQSSPCQPVPPQQAPAKKILYVEDNAANLLVLEELIKQVPHVEMLSAHTGELGLELTNNQKFDLILVDINLPGISGYKVFEGLKPTQDCPVFALSANAMEKDVARGLSAGFDEYLTKPLDLNLTLEKITNALFDKK